MSSWPPDSPLHDVDGPTTGARPNPGANAGSDSGATSLLPNPSMLRGLLLSYAPAALSPALWAFATAPERLTWTTQVSSRIFSPSTSRYCAPIP